MNKPQIYLLIIFIIKYKGSSQAVDESELICTHESIPNENSSDVVSFEMKKPVDPFIGRVEQLQWLTNLENSKKPIVITGKKGIGKTELTRKYIMDYTQRNEKISTVWIDSTSYDSLISGFQDFGSYIGINVDDEKTPSEIIEEVFLYFINKRVVFIFDNGENNNYVLNNLEKFITGRPVDLKIIITSRDENWRSDKFNILKLDVFSKDEAVEFVEKYMIVNNTDDVDKLVEILKYIPLALSKSLKYIKDKNNDGVYTISDFIKEYSEIESYKQIEMEPLIITDTATASSLPEPNIVIIRQTTVRPPTREEIQGEIIRKVEAEAKRFGTRVENEVKRNVKKVRNFFKRLRNDVGL